jgi:hypothetical protein
VRVLPLEPAETGCGLYLEPARNLKRCQRSLAAPSETRMLARPRASGNVRVGEILLSVRFEIVTAHADRQECLSHYNQQQKNDLDVTTP